MNITEAPEDLRRLAASLEVDLPFDCLDWDRVRSRFLLALMRGIPENSAAAAVVELLRRRLTGDEPSEAEWEAAHWGVAPANADFAAAQQATSQNNRVDYMESRARQRADLLAALQAELAAADAPSHACDPTPTHLTEQSLTWLRHAAALGRAEPQALLHLLQRVEALEAAAGPQPDKLDRLAEVFRAEDEAGATPAPVEPAALPEPPELSKEEIHQLWGPLNEHPADCVRRIHRAGWDAAMAAVMAQRQQSAAASVQEILRASGVFKGEHGLEGFANADGFWENQPYGTRLYYGDGGLDYLHRDVLRSAISLIKQLGGAPANPAPPPAPSAPATLVQQLACLIAGFASTIPAGDATRTAIAAVRLVADWGNSEGWSAAARVLSAKADRAAAGLEGRAAPPAAPAGGLVWRVARAADCYPYENARAAIREVAAWLDQNRETVSNGGLCAGLLRYEAAKQEARDNG